MTDRELTPEQDDAVRRLLADARHDEPIPEDVALRLDDVLAGLVAERAEEAGDAAGTAGGERPTIVPLRRRRWPKVLVAAASVCAIGLGATQVIGGGAGDDAATDGGDTQARVESDDSPRDGLLGGNDAEETPEVREPGPASAPGFEGERGAMDDSLDYYNLDRVSVSSLSAVARQLERSDRGPLQVLAPDHLPSKLRQLLGDLDNGQWDKAGKGNRGAAEELAADRAYDARIAPVACGPVYTVVGGRATYATYHDKLALVIFHPEVHGAQLVELYVCSGRTPRRSVERVTLWDGE